jgi:cardiolipin synthase
VYSSGSFGGSFARDVNQRYRESKEDLREEDRSVNSSDGLAWRDTQIRMVGPVVGEFQKLFMDSWYKQKGEPLENHDYFPTPIIAGRDLVRAIGSTPDEPFSLIYVTLISAINSAESQIYITNAYFVPDEQMLKALKEAAMRGVDVRLLLPSKTDSSLVFYASHSYYNELLESGVRIYERQDALLHAKTAMIDGVWSTVGSSNMDWRSFLNNQEINAVILGQDFARSMQSLYEQDLHESKEITLSEWRRRSLLMRVKELSASVWARFL